MRALEWTDVNLKKRQLRVERNDWRGQVIEPPCFTAPSTNAFDNDGDDTRISARYGIRAGPEIGDKRAAELMEHKLNMGSNQLSGGREVRQLALVAEHRTSF